eukprot:355109-Ditylum_brightwellii.AAC.1
MQGGPHQLRPHQVRQHQNADPITSILHIPPPSSQSSHIHDPPPNYNGPTLTETNDTTHTSHQQTRHPEHTGISLGVQELDP